MRKRHLILTATLLISGIATTFGQDTIDNSWKTYPSGDQLRVERSDTAKAPVATMVKPVGEGKSQHFAPTGVTTYSAKWLEQGERPGYRIQIYLGQSSTDSKTAKSNFMHKFDDQTAYQEYDSPNFKVKVGDFRTRLEAEEYLEKLKARYPSAYVVSSLIKPVRLD